MREGYVGIPFVDKGRTLDGCDCWGLVRIVHLEIGISLPSYGEISAKQLLAVTREMRAGLNDETWVDVANQPRRAMDVIVMRKLDAAENFPYHVGIMLSASKMLHTVRAADSHTVRLDDPSVKTSIIAYRRHRDLS